MNRIDERFDQLRASGRTALIPYITAGHPVPEATVNVMHAAVAAGADLLELGIPFSDVMADGPVIQNACLRALEQGTDLDRVLAMTEQFRAADAETPVILMGYMNPLERRGMDRFAARASAAGVDGLLIVDCPFDEAAETRQCLEQAGLHQIFLVAPTTTPDRLERMRGMVGGFIYYVSLKGVTGAAGVDLDQLAPAIGRIRAMSELPVAVGFGISTPEQAARVAAVADGVVIGSALVRELDGAGTADQAAARAKAFLVPVRAAVDNATTAGKDERMANA